MGSTLKSQWVSFLETSMPKDAGVVQYTETKRAFYAGAISCLTCVVDGVSAETSPEDFFKEIKGNMRNIYRELEGFSEDVKGGKA